MHAPVVEIGPASMFGFQAKRDGERGQGIRRAMMAP